MDVAERVKLCTCGLMVEGIPGGCQPHIHTKDGRIDVELGAEFNIKIRKARETARLEMLATHVDKAKALDMITAARQDERRKVLEERATAHSVTANYLEDLAKQTNHAPVVFCPQAEWHKEQVAVLRALAEEAT